MYYDDDQADIMHMIDSYDEPKQEKYVENFEVNYRCSDREYLDIVLHSLECLILRKHDIKNKYIVKYKVVKLIRSVGDNTVSPNELYPTIFDENNAPIETAYPDDYAEALDQFLSNNTLYK